MSNITFSEDQQLALLGHAIQTPRVLEAMVSIGIPKTLFSKANPEKIYGFLESFINKYHRSPTLDELKSGELQRDEPKVVSSILNTIDNAITKKNLIALESVYDDMLQWYIGGVVVNGLYEVEDIWNNKKNQALVVDKIHELSSKLNHITKFGLSAQLQTSDKWLDVSIARRREVAKKLIATGITFVDDAMCLMRPDTLLVITSRTGKGKTEILSKMVNHMATNGVKPAYFALEAGTAEIESRLTFPIILELYHKDANKEVTHKTIDYAKWYNGLYPDLYKYDEPAKGLLNERFKNVSMLYKKSSHYGIKQLEKDIMSIVNEVDIIIIDHLHYIDRDGKDENAALQEIIAKIRDINLQIDKPIILACHVRKNLDRKKDRALIPETDDLHGSSDISKVSTWILTLAPMAGVDEDKVPFTQLLNAGYGQPTIMSFLKSRDGGGSRTAYAAMTFYGKYGYHKNYVLGKLISFDQKWEPLPKEMLPSWADHAIEMPKQRTM